MCFVWTCINWKALTHLLIPDEICVIQNARRSAGNVIHNYFKAEACKVCRGMSESSSDTLGVYLRLGFTTYATFCDFRSKRALWFQGFIGSSSGSKSWLKCSALRGASCLGSCAGAALMVPLVQVKMLVAQVTLYYMYYGRNTSLGCCKPF